MNFSTTDPLRVISFAFALLLAGCEAVSVAKPTPDKVVLPTSERAWLGDTLKTDPMMDAVSKRYPAQWDDFVEQLRTLIKDQASIDEQHRLIEGFRRTLAPQLRELTSRMPANLLPEFFAVKADTYAYHARHSPQRCEQAMLAGPQGRAAMQQLFGTLPQHLRDRHVRIMVRVIQETNPGVSSDASAIASSDARIDAALRSDNEPSNTCAAFAARIERIETLSPSRAAAVYRSLLPGVVPTVYRVPARVRVMSDGHTIAVSGRLGRGTSDRLQAVLGALHEPSTVLLDSEGGLLSEGQRIAQTIAQLDLDTRVENSCASACTIAFLAGRQRLANPDAMIGFHQAGSAKASTVSYLYRSVADYRRLYSHQAITDDFLARVARTPLAEIWYPKRDELIRNGIVTDAELFPIPKNTLKHDRVVQRLLKLEPVQAFARRYPAEWQEEKDRLEYLLGNGVGIERIGRFALARVFGRYHTLKRNAPDALVTDAVRYLHQRMSNALSQGRASPRLCSFQFLDSAARAGVQWQQAIVAGVIATAKPGASEAVDDTVPQEKAWQVLQSGLNKKDWRIAWSETSAQYSVQSQCQARVSVLESLLALPAAQASAAARRLWMQRM